MCSKDLRQNRPELRLKDNRTRLKSREAAFKSFKGGRGVGELANIRSDISDDYRRIGISSKVFLFNFIDCLESVFVSGNLKIALQYETRLLDKYEQRKFYRILSHCFNGVQYCSDGDAWRVEMRKNWGWKIYPVYHFDLYARSAYHALGGRKRRSRDFDDAVQNYILKYGWK